MCGFRMGQLVRSGCSRAERVGYWVECCHTTAKKQVNVHDCKAPIDFKTDASTKCENHYTSGHTDTSALEIIGASTGDKSFSQCKAGCELQKGVAGWNSCDVCGCLFGCQVNYTHSQTVCSTVHAPPPPVDTSFTRRLAGLSGCADGQELRALQHWLLAHAQPRFAQQEDLRRHHTLQEGTRGRLQLRLPHSVDRLVCAATLAAIQL